MRKAPKNKPLTFRSELECCLDTKKNQWNFEKSLSFNIGQISKIHDIASLSLFLDVDGAT